ncbi:protein BatD [Dyella monticola]|uniref:Protein BatD n=1 Tax=Dyella monticola TaxID=1927958 RepID=A0A370X3G1_9GAMM|nr:BatD family protein [Dyella monticola]RDS82949.1 protein BatD [Dyella monticola]
MRRISHDLRTLQATRWRWLVLLCLLVSWNAFATSVQATLDRNDVRLGETVTLNLRIDGDANVNTPNLSALDSDFEVLGTSTNSTLNIVNGQQSSELIIGVALRPKHTGDLQIPSLTVAGNPTQPLTLHVDPPDASAAANAGKEVFVDVTANPNHVYVGQQLLYTVRLFFDVNLNSGNLADPQASGVDLRKLGNDVDYESVRNGRRYHVIERRYALIPQRAGPLTIPSIEFQGEATDPTSPNDPGGFFNPGGLFGNTTPVTADSPPVNIDVQAPPPAWGKTTWLPARSLTLSLEGVPSDNKLTVGQPLNLRMVVEATGLSGDALPELSLPTIDGATVYPDQSNTTTHDDGQWLTGHRERSFAIFPQRTGTLTLPQITLTWFDVQTGQKRVATLPAHSFNVVAAGGAPAATSSSTQPAAMSSPTAASSVASSLAASPAATAPSMVWRWVALGSIALWLISMVLFGGLYWRRRSSTLASAHKKTDDSTDSARAQRQAFTDAARGSDLAVQARRLLAWARAERPALRNLGEVAEALASEEQRAAIALLQREQYASVSAQKRIDLAALFAKGFAWRTDDVQADSPLPPLYPFKLD